MRVCLIAKVKYLISFSTRYFIYVEQNEIWDHKKDVLKKFPLGATVCSG